MKYNLENNGDNNKIIAHNHTITEYFSKIKENHKAILNNNKSKRKFAESNNMISIISPNKEDKINFSIDNNNQIYNINNIKYKEENPFPKYTLG